MVAGQSSNHITASRTDQSRSSADPPEEPVHDRLYQAAFEAKWRRAESTREKKRAEILECTFRPSVNTSRYDRADRVEGERRAPQGIDDTGMLGFRRNSGVDDDQIQTTAIHDDSLSPCISFAGSSPTPFPVTIDSQG